MCTIFRVYTVCSVYVYVYRCVWMIDEQIYRVRNKWKFVIQSQTIKKKPHQKTLNCSSSFLEFKWKFLHILLWRYQFFTILLIGFSLSFQRLLSFYYWTLWKKAKFSHSSTSFVKFCPMDFLNLRVVFSV